MTHLLRGLVNGRAAVLHGAGAHRAGAPLDGVGIGMNDAHSLHRHAQLFGRDLGQRGLVALTEGSGTASHGCCSVSLDVNRTPFRADTHRGDLDIDRQADAQLVAVSALASLCLLRAQLSIRRYLEHLVERLLVVTGVVCSPAGGGVGEAIARDEVAAPQFGRVHLKLGRQHVHRPLDHCGSLGPPSAAISAKRRRVGDHAIRLVIDCRDGVHAR